MNPTMRTSQIRQARVTAVAALALLLAAGSPAVGGSAAARTGPAGAPAGQEKVVLQFGPTPLTPEQFLVDLPRMTGLPFDGYTVRLGAMSQGSGTVNGDSRVFSSAVPEEDFAADRAQLSQLAATPGAPAHNFVVLKAAADAGWDWLDDAAWAAAESNVRQVARTTQVGHVEGIVFDPEPYIDGNGLSNPWYYPTQPSSASTSFADYEQVVRQRGRAWGAAMYSEDPDLRFMALGLLSFTDDVTTAQWDSPQALDQALATHKYGLLPAFVNGVLDALPPGQSVVDGNEDAYWYRYQDQYAAAEADLASRATELVEPANRVAYDATYTFGHAVYVDWALDLWPVDLVGLSMPHFLSRADQSRYLEAATYRALTSSDRYVWIYAERLTTWYDASAPQRGLTAIASAKEKYLSGQALGFDPTPEIEAASAECVAAGGGSGIFPC
ncbi:MAG: hypothetical protein ACRCYQ_05375 [Nocardioides sp.]